MDSMHSSPESNYAAPTYDLLMVVNAAITIIEFPNRLDSIPTSLSKMEAVSNVIERSGRNDVVFEWALSVMKRIANGT